MAPAENIGPVINTSANEETPFISKDGNTLYFSSQGHDGIGGYDIYYSTKDANGKWGNPVNLGYPVNTTDDDLFYCPVGDGSFGYTARNMKHGLGDLDIIKLEIFSDKHPYKFSIEGNLADIFKSSTDTFSIRIQSKGKTIDSLFNLSNTSFNFKEPSDNYALNFLTKECNLTSNIISIPNDYPKDEFILTPEALGVSNKYKNCIVQNSKKLEQTNILVQNKDENKVENNGINIVLNKPIVETSQNIVPEKDTLGKINNEPISVKSTEKDINDLVLSAEKFEQQGNNEEASNQYFTIGKLFNLRAQFNNALKYLKKALVLFKQIGNKPGQSEVLDNMASVYYNLGQYNQTISVFKEALALKREIGDENGQAAIFSEISEAMGNTYQYEGASENLLEALAIYQKLGNQVAIFEAYDKLGSIYYNQNDYQKSLVYFKKALNSEKVSKDINLKEDILNSIGVVLFKMGKYDEALKYYNQAIELDKETGNKKNLSISYNNIGNINFNWNKYENAINYYQKSLNLKKELNFEEGMAVSIYNIGNSYLELNQYIKAKEFLLEGIDLAKKIKFNMVLQLSYKALSKLYEETKDYQNATYSYKLYVSLIGHGFIQDGQISETNDLYDRESKLIKSLRHDLEWQKNRTDFVQLQNDKKEKEIRIKNIELKNQKAKALIQLILLISSIIFLLFVGFLALQFYLKFQQKKKYSEVISYQKQQILDSITYASRIQNAVFIPGDQMKSVFPKSFIFNRPKDVVSGDYYFITNKNDKIYIAVADCTGHGVPGAFMSMLGISLIKEVLLLENVYSANEVLNELREALMKALHQTGRDDEAKDGMDIALCVIDFVNMRLEYSGANNPCYIFRNNQLIELKGDRMPIGIYPVLKPFTNKEASIEKDDVIYLFSDGFQDQLGEEANKKFKVGQFVKMLTNLSTESIENQPKILDETLNKWRGNFEQTDDILIVGFKV